MDHYLWIELESFVKVSFSCPWHGIWFNFQAYMAFPYIKHTNALLLAFAKSFGFHPTIQLDTSKLYTGLEVGWSGLPLGYL